MKGNRANSTIMRLGAMDSIDNGKKRRFFNFSVIKPASRSRNWFFTEFRPIFLTLKMLGMLPYKVNEEGDILWKFWSKEMLYSVIVFGLTSTPVCYIFYLRYKQILKIQENFQLMMFSITMTCLMVPHTVIPCSHWMGMNTFVKVCRRWKHFQDSWEELFGKPLKFLLYWKIIIIAPWLMIYFVVIYCIWEFSNGCYLEVIAQIYVITFFLMHNILFVGQIFVITRFARSLRVKLLKIIAEERVEGVALCTNLWLHLTKMVGNTGMLFYKMYVHFLIMVFIITTMALFGLLKCLLLENLTWFTLNKWLCFALGKTWIVIICECGERASAYVGSSFATSLVHSRLRIKNETVRNKVQELIQLTTQFPPVVSFSGFFVVNRALLASISATGVMYLIIVLQFAQSFPTDGFSYKNASLDCF